MRFITEAYLLRVFTSWMVVAQGGGCSIVSGGDVSMPLLAA